jgi:hypothetical protein
MHAAYTSGEPGFQIPYYNCCCKRAIAGNGVYSSRHSGLQLCSSCTVVGCEVWRMLASSFLNASLKSTAAFGKSFVRMSCLHACLHSAAGPLTYLLPTFCQPMDQHVSCCERDEVCNCRGDRFSSRQLLGCDSEAVAYSSMSLTCMYHLVHEPWRSGRNTQVNLTDQRVVMFPRKTCRKSCVIFPILRSRGNRDC